MSVATLNSLNILNGAPANPAEAGLFNLKLRERRTNETNKPTRSKASNRPLTDSDVSLVNRTLDGNKKAFDMLVIKYQTRISRLVSVYIQDFDAARDVVQETFIRAYNALHNYRRESQFYTWLYRIAVNTSCNYLKSNKSWLTRMESMEGNVQAEQAESQYLDPEHSYQNDDLRDGIQRAVAQLPMDLRCVLLLREMEGMTYEQIAEIVGCELGTVKSRISRARERIVQKTEHLYERR